jgi:hypothetical protein
MAKRRPTSENSQEQSKPAWQFPKGKSGNPGGRPKLVGHVRELAQKQTDQAIQTLVKIMGDDTAPPASRVSAAQAILDRGWGKPSQPMEGVDGNALFPTQVEVVLVRSA